MSVEQIAYTLILAVLWAAGADRLVVGWLTANLVAMLAIAGAMDIGLMTREDATILMMLADLATGAILAFGPGLAKLVALGYAITVPLYSLELIFSISVDTTVAIVLAVAFVQLGIVGIGTIGGGGGSRDDDGRRRPGDPLALRAGDQMRVASSHEVVTQARLTE